MKTKIIMVVMAGVALGLIGYGCFTAYRPAGFIVPGILLWIDVTRMSKGA